MTNEQRLRNINDARALLLGTNYDRNRRFYYVHAGCKYYRQLELTNFIPAVPTNERKTRFYCTRTAHSVEFYSNSRMYQMSLFKRSPRIRILSADLNILLLAFISGVARSQFPVSFAIYIRRSEYLELNSRRRVMYAAAAYTP